MAENKVSIYLLFCRGKLIYLHLVNVKYGIAMFV